MTYTTPLPKLLPAPPAPISGRGPRRRRTAGERVVAVALAIAAAGTWAPALHAQDGGSDAAAAAEQPAAPAARMQADIPRRDTNLIYVEAEDAVATTYDTQPILNYAVSRRRTLQLNRFTPLQDGTPFFSDYVFFVEEPGTYEFWYGGTPPGPADDLLESYHSPFLYQLDGQSALPVYRETVNVVEEYAPAYFWNKIGELELEAGRHTLRFEVSERRRFDNKFVFYLDAFFFLRQGSEPAAAAQPPKFPTNRAARNVDEPFRSIGEYERLLRTEPSNVSLLLELGNVYSMIGDYLNAIKFFRRARLVDESNSEALLLLAKNRIWRGDIDTGLQLYQELLNADPDRLENWLEAGKVAAWTQRYGKSVQFFQDALGRFPDNLDAIVNLGLTYLWAGLVNDAERAFDAAWAAAQASVELKKQLAAVYELNGDIDPANGSYYIERAITTYRRIIAEHPTDLAAYLALEDLYVGQDRPADAARQRQLITDSFVPTPRLAAFLENHRERQGLRDQVIADYQEQLATDPDNLPLRLTLAQTYYWNGLRDAAIGEYLNIITNYAFVSLREMDNDGAGLFAALDQSFLFAAYARRAAEQMGVVRRDLRTQLTKLVAARSALQRAQEAETANQELVGELRQAPAEETASNRERREARRQAAETAGEELSETRRQRQGLLEFEQTAMAILLDQADVMRERLVAAQRDYDLLASRAESLVAAEAAEHEAFVKLTDSTGWRWDRAGLVRELGAKADAGLSLASHVLGKINLLEGSHDAARRQFAGCRSNGGVPVECSYGQLQATLWSGQVAVEQLAAAADDPELTSYMPHVVELARLSETLLTADEPLPVLLPDDLEAQVALVITRLGEASEQALGFAAVIERDSATLRTVGWERLLRTMFRFQGDTFLLRNDLGDFYLAIDNLPRAVEQFSYVLAVDPLNIDALYSMGRAQQRNGNWSQAQRFYREVVELDPFYENALRQYNQLARANADRFDFAATMFADPFTRNWTGTVTTRLPISAGWAIHLAYQADAMQLQQQTTTNVSYLANQLTLALPLSYDPWQLRIVPSGGGLVVGNSLGYQGAAVDATGEGLSDLRIFPIGGAELGLGFGRAGAWRTSYVYQPFRETLEPTAIDPDLMVHEVETELSWFPGFIPVAALRGFSARSFGELQVLPAAADNSLGSNYIWTAAQDLSWRLFELGTPVHTLTLLTSGIFRDWVDPDPATDDAAVLNATPHYFAPNSELTVSGGLTYSLWANLDDGDAFSGSLRVSGGATISALDTATPTSIPLVSGELFMNYNRRGARYYVAASGTLTFDPGTVDDYWSLTITGGYGGSAPRFLEP